MRTEELYKQLGEKAKESLAKIRYYINEIGEGDNSIDTYALMVQEDHLMQAIFNLQKEIKKYEDNISKIRTNVRR